MWLRKLALLENAPLSLYISTFCRWQVFCTKLPTSRKDEKNAEPHVLSQHSMYAHFNHLQTNTDSLCFILFPASKMLFKGIITCSALVIVCQTESKMSRHSASESTWIPEDFRLASQLYTGLNPFKYSSPLFGIQIHLDTNHELESKIK